MELRQALLKAILRGLTPIDELRQLLNVLLRDHVADRAAAAAPRRISLRTARCGFRCARNQINGGKLVTKEEKEKLDE
jgi:hypothetical protein